MLLDAEGSTLVQGVLLEHTSRVSLVFFVNITTRTIVITMSCCSILAAMYCYWRHNTYCEPGSYLFILESQETLEVMLVNE